jgi:S-adenosyl-L-methionine hydrolase (adenosine-forming)
MTRTPSPPSSAPPIALLTDFGVADGYTGVMKGVILGIAPGVALVDLTHEIPPQDVRAAAWVLHTAWRYFPQGSVFLCVVDPGVGSERHPIALQTGDHVFVGPDNGLFSYVLAAMSNATTARAVVLANPRYFPAERSATFHGRDVFAPAAAWLAAGVALDDLGPERAVESLVRLNLPQPIWRGDTLVAHRVHTDHFGNILTDITGDLAQAVFAAPAVTLTLGGQTITARARTFAEGPSDALFLYRDSSGSVAIAQRNGSALAALALSHSELDEEPITITGVVAGHHT